MKSNQVEVEIVKLSRETIVYTLDSKNHKITCDIHPKLDLAWQINRNMKEMYHNRGIKIVVPAMDFLKSSYKDSVKIKKWEGKFVSVGKRVAYRRAVVKLNSDICQHANDCENVIFNSLIKMVTDMKMYGSHRIESADEHIARLAEKLGVERSFVDHEGEQN